MPVTVAVSPILILVEFTVEVFVRPAATLTVKVAVLPLYDAVTVLLPVAVLLKPLNVAELVTSAVVPLSYFAVTTIPVLSNVSPT